MVHGLIGTIGAIASIAGIIAALLTIQPWLVPLLILAGLPLLAGVMKAGQAMFGFHLCALRGPALAAQLHQEAS
jgi:ATP-binding cassette subfamily B protein